MRSDSVLRRPLVELPGDGCHGNWCLGTVHPSSWNLLNPGRPSSYWKGIFLTSGHPFDRRGAGRRSNWLLSASDKTRPPLAPWKRVDSSSRSPPKRLPRPSATQSYRLMLKPLKLGALHSNDSPFCPLSHKSSAALKPAFGNGSMLFLLQSAAQ